MRTIEINKNYKVEVDELNKTIFRKITRVRKATGEEYPDWILVGYYNTWEQVVNKLLDISIIKKMKTKEINSIKNLQGAIETSTKEIKGLFKNMKLQ